MAPGGPPPIFLTIGHSTRSIDELLRLLRQAGARRLVDVRRFPGSRRFPHFSRPALAVSLAHSGIAYVHEPDLGGRRLPTADSANAGWRNEGFRGYADHMATPAFAAAVERLLAAGPGTVILCAEAAPWRCHRQLLADALVARGAAVQHILEEGRLQPHTLHPAARVGPQGTLTYPRASAAPLFP